MCTSQESLIAVIHTQMEIKTDGRYLRYIEILINNSVMAIPQQKAFCVFRFSKCASAITVQCDFCGTYGIYVSIAQNIIKRVIKRSEKVVICVYRND